MNLKGSIVVGTILGVMALAFGCNSSTPPASSPGTVASQQTPTPIAQVIEPVEVAQSTLSPVADVGQSTPPASSLETATSKQTPTPTAQVIKPVEVAQSAPSPVADVSQPTQTEAGLEIKIGYEVGNRVPDIEFTLDDGRTLTSKDLLSEGKPVFLFFTASW